MKAPTRKEIEKKTKEKKKEDAASNVSANATSTLFLGKKQKKYSWMASGASAGSASPAYNMSGGGGIRAAAAATAAAQEAPAELTQRSQTRLGAWRDDKSSGDKIQMRDWVAALEKDGCSTKELQRAIMWLDGNTRPKKNTPEIQ